MNETQAALLRLFTDEDAHHGDELVAEIVVARARAAGLAGATVLRGRLGFGARAVHTHRFLGVGDNPPVVIEIVDDEPRLRAFATGLADLRSIALMTLERVEVLRSGRPAAPTPEDSQPRSG